MPDGTQTYVLNGKRYTVPQGTSMDELEQFIGQQDKPPLQQKPESWWKSVKRRWSEGTQPLTDPRIATEAQAATGIDPRTQRLREDIGQAQAVSSLAIPAEAMGMPANVPGIAGAGRFIREAPGMAREGVAVAGRTPSGGLRPIVRVGSRLAGAAAGRELAGTEGAVIGALSGPSVAEAIIPKRTIAEQLRAPAAESVRAPASTSEAAPPEVLVAPEPRAPQPGVPSDSAFSIPREQLPTLTRQGMPGAGEALRATGQPVLYEPSGGTGYNAPRSRMVMGKPAAAGPKITIDSMGVKWAEGPGGVRVSIPKRIPDAEVVQYAQSKLAEQATQQTKIKSTFSAPERRTYSAKEGGNVYSRRAGERPTAMGEQPSPPLSPAEHAQAEKLAGMQLTDEQAKNFLRRTQESELAGAKGDVDVIRAMREKKGIK